MPTFCVNRTEQANGDHEVHNLTTNPGWCLPTPQNQQNLGQFDSCSGAVQAARSTYRQVNGCKYCASACHTG
jgi:hypothetical protein